MPDKAARTRERREAQSRRSVYFHGAVSQKDVVRGQREVQRLRKLKPMVPELSDFGDDNHAAIDAQIAVLVAGGDGPWVDEHYLQAAGEVYQAAMDAALWLDDPSGGSPWETWRALIDGRWMLDAE